MDPKVHRAALAPPIMTFALALVLWPASALAGQDFGARPSEMRVFDSTGSLSAAQVADLEQRALGVEKAGAPTVVYLRWKATDQAATRLDARELMDSWRVESAPGARDGLVLFANLNPNAPPHGSLALYAGAKRTDDGRLTASVLQGIYDDTMRPFLAGGNIAAGIAAGLDAARVKLEQVAPVTPKSSASAADVAVPLFGCGLGMAVFAGAFALVIRAVRRGEGGMPGGSETSSVSGSSSYVGTDSGGGSSSSGSDSSSGGGDF